MTKIGFSKIDLAKSLNPVLPIRERIESICMYLERDNVCALWIALDFMDFDRSVTDSLKKEISKSTYLDFEQIHILTTHNHGGGTPDIKVLSELVSDGAREAISNAQNALMRYTSTGLKKQVSILRRLYIPEIDGVATLYFGASEKNNYDSSAFKNNVISCLKQAKETNYMGEEYDDISSPFSPGDNELTVIEFAKPDGEPIGSVVRFAAHAVCANRKDSYSSDYPYYVRSLMSEKFGGVSMFLNGPCGEIAPCMQDKYEGREKILGKYLAETALLAIEDKPFVEINYLNDTKYSIELPVRKEVLDNYVNISNVLPSSLFEMRRHLESIRLNKTLEFLRGKYLNGESKHSDTISIFVGLLQINDLLIVAFPGETFYKTGKIVKESFENLNVCTVTEHERTVMYLPPKEDFELGGYEAVCKLTASNSEEILRENVISVIRKFYKTIL